MRSLTKRKKEKLTWELTLFFSSIPALNYSYFVLCWIFITSSVHRVPIFEVVFILLSVKSVRIRSFREKCPYSCTKWLTYYLLIFSSKQKLEDCLKPYRKHRDWKSESAMSLKVWNIWKYEDFGHITQEFVSQLQLVIPLCLPCFA